MAFEQFLANLPTNLLAPQADGDHSGQAEPHAGQPLPPAESAENYTLPTQHEAPKTGRNDPCPCGSGKKYKNCCGRVA